MYVRAMSPHLSMDSSFRDKPDGQRFQAILENAPEQP
jgi:hypothetical protein